MLFQELQCSYDPLRAPLLNLAYVGETMTPSGRRYRTLPYEAVRISAAILPNHEARDDGYFRYGTLRQPNLLIKNVVRACFDVPKLRDEVYCQLIKLTTNAPDPGSTLNQFHWNLLATMCATFLPSQKFVRFLRFHLRRLIDGLSTPAVVAQNAKYCHELQKNTKTRELPPSTPEITAILERRSMRISVAVASGRSALLSYYFNVTLGCIQCRFHMKFILFYFIFLRQY